MPAAVPTQKEIDYFCFAAAMANRHDVKEFIEKFGQKYIDAQDIHGNTALIAAANWGRLAVITILLEAGASLEVKSRAGNTALMIAERDHRDDTIALLRAWPAELQRRQEIKAAEERQHRAAVANRRIEQLKKKRTLKPFIKN